MDKILANLFVDENLHFTFSTKNNDDIKRIILSYSLMDPFIITKILKNEINYDENNNENNEIESVYIKLIYNNKQWWEFLWFKYVATKLPKNYGSMTMKEFRKLFKRILSIYKVDYDKIINNDVNYKDLNKDLNKDLKKNEKKINIKKYDVIYNNSINTNKLFNDIDNGNPVDENLINEIVYLEQVNEFQQTPLIHASNCESDEKINYDYMKILIKNGANINASAKGNDRALSNTSGNGNYEATKLLLSCPGIEINYFSFIHTPIYESVEYNHFEITKLLIEHGACVNTKVEENFTVLMKACWNGNKEIVELLLAGDASQPQGWQFRLSEIASQKNGANVNDVDDYNETALLKICSKNEEFADIVKILLNYGANQDTICYETGHTPLMSAIFHNHPNITKILFQNYINISKNNIQDNNSNNNNNDNDIVDDDIVDETLIKEIKSKLNQRDNDGNTPLMIASIYGRLEAAKMLLKYSNIHDVDNYGDNVCMKACKNNQLEILELFILNNNITCIENGHQTTVLIIACQYGNNKIIKLLNKHNYLTPTYINWYDVKRNNAIFYAKHYNRTYITKILSKCIG